MGEKWSRQDQLKEESDIRRRLLKDIVSKQDSQESNALQLQRLKSAIRGFVARSFAPDHREQVADMLKQFSYTGDRFAHEAKVFDPGLEPEDIFQALRNLWILNSLQVAFSLPVCLNRSGLAYSLLYPYTDNFLDDGTIPEISKRAFNSFLVQRLEGQQVTPDSELPARISDLVGMIEDEYPRGAFPDVYESLLSIHRAQQSSLAQSACRYDVPEEQILRISVEKGGTSVLADAFLTKGWLTEEEVEFAFAYGVFLQLIDDVQDVKEDMSSSNRTMVTLSAARGELNGMVNRLLKFLGAVLSPERRSPLPHATILTELIHRSCRGLIMESIACHPELFSKDYLQAIEPYSPLRFGFIRELRREMLSRQSNLREMAVAV